LPGGGADDVVGDAEPSPESVLIFVSSDVAQPPSTAASSAMAITTVRFIVTCLLISDLAIWMSAATAPSQPRFIERVATARLGVRRVDERYVSPAPGGVLAVGAGTAALAGGT
jgi:hypothetical protein